MKAFVDANVLVSVLNKEYPLFTYSSRVLSLSNRSNFQLYTSPLCLAISFYFSSKKSGEILAKKKIDLLLQQLRLAVVSDKSVQHAIQNKKINDLEDGFQYYAALEHDCSCIITEDQGDYYFSEIEILGSEAFLEHYAF